MNYPNPPAAFLQPIIHDLKTYPPIAALCAGYEAGSWRGKAFAEHVMEWLPEFSLTADELKTLSPGTAVRLIKKAARLVYQTEKYGKRGEFGEIFLHICLRQLYGSIPAISKIYWKDSVNSTVKGFDAVHVIANGDDLELWLGEVKFYKDGERAISDVAKEVIEHTKVAYLKNEFMLITNKLQPGMAHYGSLAKLLDKNTSLDDVFASVCIPILFTYESNAVKASGKSDASYLDSVQKEVQKFQASIESKLQPGSLPMKLHIFVIPIHTKDALVGMLDELLKEMQ